MLPLFCIMTVWIKLGVIALWLLISNLSPFLWMGVNNSRDQSAGVFSYAYILRNIVCNVSFIAFPPCFSTSPMIMSWPGGFLFLTLWPQVAPHPLWWPAPSSLLVEEVGVGVCLELSRHRKTLCWDVHRSVPSTFPTLYLSRRWYFYFGLWWLWLASLCIFQAFSSF